jgi:hypothetical protein
MNLDISQHVPEDFNAESRIWIYQSSRLFLISEALEIGDKLNNFVNAWHSHGIPVKGYANLFFGRFIVLIADESASGVSGCSTDSSVKLIKEIEKDYNVNMFNREALAFVVKDKIEVIPKAQLTYAIENNFINANTLYFNNTILSKKELLSTWIVPAQNTWLKNKFEKTTADG